jgi:hypothetical protein
MIVDVIDERYFVVTLCDDFEGVLIFFSGKVEADYIEAVVEESGEDTGLGISLLG